MLPSLNVNLEKIRQNCKVVVRKCESVGIEVVGVTKGVLGAPKIAQAMLDEGMEKIGDSRLANLKKLGGLVPAPKSLMLRQPMKDEADEVVRVADTSLISELKAASWLGRAAKKYGKKHKVILMIETGDLREGVPAQLALNLASEVVRLDGVELEGIGTNSACTTGSFPTLDKLEILVELAEKIEDKLNLELRVISGGNSSTWALVENGKIPKKINQLRIGEGILLGQETAEYNRINGTNQDAFLLQAEIIETNRKPTSGVGDLSGSRRTKAQERKRVVVALGRQDVGKGTLVPSYEGVMVVSISSDHLMLDVEDCKKKFEIGETLSFIPGYFALLCAFTSPYVEKRIT